MTTTIALLALKSLFVAAATLLLLRLTRRRSAAERSTIAHLGLFALLALPLASLALPQLAIPLPVRFAQAIAAAPTQQTTGALPDVPEQRRQLGRIDVATTGPSDSLARTIPAAAWYVLALPTLALLALTMAALLRLVGLRSRAEVLVNPAWLGALARAQRRMRFKSGAALLKSGELGSPISWGLMRPTILLNDEALVAPGQAEAIIAHELAHVVHLDWVKLILARIATAAFWFNPLAWLLAREAHQLREEAADDAVLAANITGPDYAELLIGVARHQCRGALLGAHGVAPSQSSLGRRVRRVLDQTLARRPSGRPWLAGFATGMLCMAVPLAALTIAPSKAATHGVAPPQQHAVRTAASAAPRDDEATATTDGFDDIAVGKVAESARQTASLALQRSSAVRQNVDVDALIALHAVGATADYQRAMAEAGFPSRSTEDLTGARAVGVTPEYVRAMLATGLRASAEDLIGARTTGLDPAYVAAMRQLGIGGSFEDFQGMRAVGVTPAFVRSLRARGIEVTSPEKLTALRAVGFDHEP